MHVGAVMTFAPPGSAEADGEFAEAFVALIGRRLALVPRFRQKVREVPGNLGLPVWVDDTDFDVTITYAAPRCPARARARSSRLVGRLIARPLDKVAAALGDVPRRGPVEAAGSPCSPRDHAMVDGSRRWIGELLLDSTPEPREVPLTPVPTGAEP